MSSPEQNRAWRLAHPGYHTNYQREYRLTEQGLACVRKGGRRARERRRDWMNQIKNRPCLDCGNRFLPEVMEFDHRDPSQKEHDMSHSGRALGKEKFLLEVSKCDIVCANCHRQRTVNRRKGLPAVLPEPEYHI